MSLVQTGAPGFRRVQFGLCGTSGEVTCPRDRALSPVTKEWMRAQGLSFSSSLKATRCGVAQAIRSSLNKVTCAGTSLILVFMNKEFYFFLSNLCTLFLFTGVA